MRDFAELTHLETAGLRALLDEGEAPERVRAAWALALRLGEGLRPELSEAARTEPEPGVRRHLVVMLAGYQERSVLAALAQGDPDDEVRAAACQYLAVLGRAEDAASWRILHERLTSERSSGVLRSCILYLPPHAPAMLRAAVAAHVGAESLEVRRVAADKLLDWAGLAGAGLPAELVPRLSREGDPELRAELVRRGHALDGGHSLLKAVKAEDFPRETIHFLLEDFTRRGWTLVWEDLRPFAVREWPEVDVFLPELLAAEAPAEANTWLLKVALRFWCDRDQDYDGNTAHAADGALDALSPRLKSRPDEALDSQGRELARELLALLEEERTKTLMRHLEECDASNHEECLLEVWGYETILMALHHALASPVPR